MLDADVRRRADLIRIMLYRSACPPARSRAETRSSSSCCYAGAWPDSTWPAGCCATGTCSTSPLAVAMYLIMTSTSSTRIALFGGADLRPCSEELADGEPADARVHGLIALLFVVPMWAYINLTERLARIERDKAIEAGRHEPVTIQPFVDLSVCMGSGACVPACPEHVLEGHRGAGDRREHVGLHRARRLRHGLSGRRHRARVRLGEARASTSPGAGRTSRTNVPGVFIAGELGGMGLIANAAEQGPRDDQRHRALPESPSRRRGDRRGGPAGIARGARLAKQKGLKYVILDQDALGGAVRHYPRKKLVFTRPMTCPDYGTVNLKPLQKEELVGLFETVVKKPGSRCRQRAGREAEACGRRLPGRHVEADDRGPAGDPGARAARDPAQARRQGRGAGEGRLLAARARALPVRPPADRRRGRLGGRGGDAAGEQAGNRVWLSYRGDKINRPKDRLERLRDAVKAGQVELLLESQVKSTSAQDPGGPRAEGREGRIPNDYVFVMVGGVLPTKFLQEVGVRNLEALRQAGRVGGGRRGLRADPRAAPLRGQPGSQRPTLSFIQAPVDSQSIDEAPLLRAQGNDEPTVSLLHVRARSGDRGAARLCLLVRGHRRAPRGAPLGQRSGAPGTAAMPSQPADTQLDEVGAPALSAQFGEGPETKEVTEIELLSGWASRRSSRPPRASRPSCCPTRLRAAQRPAAPRAPACRPPRCCPKRPRRAPSRSMARGPAE